MSKLLSIIVPVYKVEDYVEACLRSCAEQEGVSPDDYEIIVVNDGSPDNSMAICERLAQEYSHIRLFSQNNAGVSVARNKGVEEACGEYIWFVDSDDWVERDALQQFFSYFRQHPGLDIVCIHGRIDYEDGSIDEKKYRYVFESETDGPTQIMRSAFPTTPQWSLYRRSFLLDNNLRFFPGIYHEDSEFIPRAFYLAKRVASLEVMAYHLRRGSRESTTAVFRLKNALDTLLVMEHLHTFSKDLPLAHRRGFNRLISRTMNNILLGAPQLKGEDRQVLFRHLKQKSYLFDLMRQSGKTKYILEGWMLKHAMRLTFRLYHLMK